MLFIGLDISLRETAVCVLTQTGEIVWQGKVLSDPEDIVRTLDRWKGEIGLAGLEACPLSEWIFTGLVTHGIEARCIEARHAQRFLSTRPVKTDKNDARGIADMMRLGHYRPVHVKSRGAQKARRDYAPHVDHRLGFPLLRSTCFTAGVSDSLQDDERQDAEFRQSVTIPVEGLGLDHAQRVWMSVQLSNLNMELLAKLRTEA